VDRKALTELLGRVASGEVAVDEACERLRLLPFDGVTGDSNDKGTAQHGDIATVDHHRELRSGIPEIIYGESKSAAEIIAISRLKS